jgi:hypothetical protein
MTPKEVRAKWVAALRSGKYKQGKYSLRSNYDNYCCLGVLCELAAQEGIAKRTGGTHENFRYDDHNTNLPESVIRWAGLSDRSGGYVKDDVNNPTSLMSDNDGHHKDFNEIADIIESEPKGLFNEEALPSN